MDLKDFYRLIIRYLLVILLSSTLGLGVAIGVNYYTTPLYEAKIQLFVSTQSTESDISTIIAGSSFTQQRVKSYAQIISSPSTLAPVIEKLGLDISPEVLSTRVKASAPLDTVLINVTVTDESPTLAAKVANGLGDHFSTFVNELELSRADLAPAIKVSVVKSASPPKSPSTPRTSLNILLGLVLGVGFGVGIAILRQLFDGTIKNEDDLEETQLLAAIGHDKEAEKKPLITQVSRYSSRTEAFRQLRTNLQYLTSEKQPKVIAITSALPGEGKTWTSLNLALSIAQSGNSVVFVECDMRRPKTAKYMELARDCKGLSELLSGKLAGTLDSMLAEVLLGDGSLRVIPSGAIPPNPAELLDSETFDSFINLLRAEFEFVIIDCPPALPVADAAIISTRVDGIIVVIEAGETRKNQFLGVRDALTQVGGNILGAVLNKVPHGRNYADYGYRYGYGYGYQRKYASSEYGGYKSDKPYAADPNRQH